MVEGSGSTRNSAADDPGYLRSITSKTVLGQFRLIMVAILLVPIAVIGLVPLVAGVGASPVLYVVLPPLLAISGFVMARMLVLRSAPPLPVRLPHGEDHGATAVAALRQATYLPLALTEAPLLIGFMLSVVAGSTLPYLAGFVVGWPLMVVASLPTHTRIERIRASLESQGATSHLWDVLLSAPRSYVH
ncbi:MAG TPA: hypothetical protein VLC50_02970 [Actinomycetes bacterium]|nr:hypothetical protein [Actinomycetes bacterium]